MHMFWRRMSPCVMLFSWRNATVWMTFTEIRTCVQVTTYFKVCPCISDDFCNSDKITLNAMTPSTRIQVEFSYEELEKTYLGITANVW